MTTEMKQRVAEAVAHRARGRKGGDAALIGRELILVPPVAGVHLYPCNRLALSPLGQDQETIEQRR